MERSSSKFKALAVSAGMTFWFFIISNAFSFFTLELLGIFVASIVSLTLIFANKISKVLDVFAILNTEIFLGIMFIFVISLYGIFFRLLRIDLLRLKSQEKTYWIDIEQLKEERILKQY